MMGHNLTRSDRSTRPFPQIPVSGGFGQSKGRLESEIAESMVAYCRDQTGRGPESIRAMLLDDLLIIRQRGTLSPSEVRLAATSEGWELVSQARRKLAEMDRDELSKRITNLTGRRVLDLLTDTSRAGCRVDVFILDHERIVGTIPPTH